MIINNDDFNLCCNPIVNKYSIILSAIIISNHTPEQ